MKRLWNAIRNYSWGVLTFAIALVAAGLAFLAFAEISVEWATRVIAAIALILAVFRAASVLAAKQRGFKFFFRMLFPVTVIIASVFMLITPQNAFSVFLNVAGLLVIIDGSFKLKTAVLSKRYTVWTWWFLLVLSALTITVGFLLIKLEISSVTGQAIFLGLTLILDGVQNFFVTFYDPTVEKHRKEEILAEAEKEKVSAEPETRPASEE